MLTHLVYATQRRFKYLLELNAIKRNGFTKKKKKRVNEQFKCPISYLINIFDSGMNTLSDCLDDVIPMCVR